MRDTAIPAPASYDNRFSGLRFPSKAFLTAAAAARARRPRDTKVIQKIFSPGPRVLGQHRSQNRTRHAQGRALCAVSGRRVERLSRAASRPACCSDLCAATARAAHAIRLNLQRAQDGL